MQEDRRTQSIRPEAVRETRGDSGEGHIPDWRLPVGVNRSLWEYVTDFWIAEGFDRDFAESHLLQVDREFLDGHFHRPGRLVDLGCGTGRVLEYFARRGFQTVGVDLSPRMLKVSARKAEKEGLPIALVRANLCQLDAFAAESFDYAACMFSTIGMIIGLDNRRRALCHIRRLLRPGGLFGLHVHNRWYNFRDPQGRQWFWSDLWKRLRLRPDAGDKIMPQYRGIPNLRLHIYTAAEIRRELRCCGFRVVELIPLRPDRAAPLKAPWLFGNLRANGWLIMVRAA